jgi:hypothetical protein
VTRRILITILIALVVFVGFDMATAPPASAHFMYGANCHIEVVRQSGSIKLKLTNRTYQAGYVQCGLVTYGGGAPTRQHYVTRWMPARWYRYVWVFYPGNWQYVRINHVHLYR